MSLAISVFTPEGVVLAADSRQTFKNSKGMVRVGSESACKLFQINNQVGVTATGLAFLPEDGVMKSLSKFIDEFNSELETKELEVKDVAEKLHYFFGKKYDYKEQLSTLSKKIKNDLEKQGLEISEMKKVRNSVKFRFKDSQGQAKEGKASIEALNLLVAGYNKNGKHEAYACQVPGEVQKKRDGGEKGNEYGASWIGQTDVVSRIVLGFDGRIGNLNFVNQVTGQIGQGEVEKQLRGLEYVIRWGMMSLQDAVEFCVLMIETTSAIQKFSDGIKINPGDMPGVGGPVDVAAITPEKGFFWVKRKELELS